jgi:2-dehydropantoate 2-reductase
MERRAPIEADHILGDLLRRGSQILGVDHSLLRLSYRHLKAYEARRDRERTAADSASS